MTETEFIERTDRAIRKIEDAIEASGADIDFDLAGGNVLELEFENGSKIIVSRQAAAQEIWVAAKSGGLHFSWKAGGWSDTRSGEGLYTALSRLIMLQAGISIMFD